MLGRLPLVALLVSGCSVDDLDLSNRDCPCVDGWTCNEATGRCEPAGGVDASMGTDADRPPVDSSTPADTSTPPSDAGTPTDAPPPTPDSGQPPTGCATVHAGRLFCDGFEDDDGFAAWDGERGMGTLERVTDIVYRGEAALKATRLAGGNCAAGTSCAELYKAVFSAAAAGDQFYRAYYYVPSDPGLPLEIHTIYEQTFTQELLMNISEGSTNFHTHGTWGVPTASAPDTFPVDQWVCVEMQVHFDDMEGFVDIYWDGELVLQGTRGDSTVPAGIEIVTAGISWREVSLDAVVYVDEVIADTSPIGCD